MKAKSLNGILKLSSRISNPSSLTSLYRAVEIGPNSIRCCSEFGNLHILLDGDTGVKNAVLLDCESLQAITSSLSQEQEITFIEDDNKVRWSCAEAKGHLNHVHTEYSVPAIHHEAYPWTPPKDFANAILLASSACQAAAVSVGLYGIEIEPIGDKLNFTSSNSISLAKATVEKGTYPAGKVTVRPPVPGIIAALLSACPGCTLDITDEGIFILGDWLMAQLPLGVALEHDLKSYSDPYTTANETTEVNSAAVKRFIIRAKNLTERSANFQVNLKVEEGKLVLSHQGIASSTEEYFLAAGLPPTSNYKSVALPADLLLLPLEFIQVVVLDYLKDQTLVLRGKDPEFMYVVGGVN